MKIELRILNEDGSVAATLSGPAHQPLQWKSGFDNPLIDGDPKDRHYKLWAVTVQPTCTLSLRPTR